MASSQWLFTASHGARMLRESNPRTVPGRHLSKVVKHPPRQSKKKAGAAAAPRETAPADGAGQQKLEPPQNDSEDLSHNLWVG